MIIQKVDPLKERQNVTLFLAEVKFSMKSISGTRILFVSLATGHFSGHTGSSDIDFKVGVVPRGRANEQSHRQTVKKIKNIMIQIEVYPTTIKVDLNIFV